MSFSPVEIAFATRAEAIGYLNNLTSWEESVLVLASNRRVSQLGLQQWLSNIKKSGSTVHLGQIPTNPTISDVYNTLKLLHGYQPSKVIAIGGGSCIDLAKAISALFYLIPEDSLSLQAVRSAVREKKYLENHPFIEVIAVPTTSGTGSEVTKWATIWDMEQKEKLSVDCTECFPKMALIVPEFTVSMSERLTLATGLDALSHAMEAFWARARTPLSQALALTSIEYVKEYLPKVLCDGNNLELRKGMSLASLIAGLSFSITRTTACHSISYPLTMYYGVDHGFATAITLAQVADRNAAVVQEISKIYDIFGGKTQFEQWLKNVSHSVQDLKLSAFGMSKDDIEFISEKTFTQGRMDNNPINFSSDEIKDILEKVL